MGSRVYEEGEMVRDIEWKAACDNCFCAMGAVRCVPLACAPPLQGCSPIVRQGHCCPSTYNCSESLQCLRIRVAAISPRPTGPPGLRFPVPCLVTPKPGPSLLFPFSVSLITRPCTGEPIIPNYLVVTGSLPTFFFLPRCLDRFLGSPTRNFNAQR